MRCAISNKPHHSIQQHQRLSCRSCVDLGVRSLFDNRTSLIKSINTTTSMSTKEKENTSDDDINITTSTLESDGVSVMLSLIKQSFRNLPQGNTGLPLARLISSSGPSMQILLAALMAYRYYPTISARDILFCVMYPSYLYLANNLRFKNNQSIRERAKDHPYNISVVNARFFSGSDATWFKKYMTLAATIGLLLPLLTIISAPRQMAALAAPHLVLLWCQIIGEGMTMFNPNVHRYITLLVPLGFSAYRMNLLVEWFSSSFSLWSTHMYSDYTSAYAWGVVLSSINLIFWTYNLFVALLLKITPEFLDKTRCEYPEMKVMIFEPKPKVNDDSPLNAVADNKKDNTHKNTITIHSHVTNKKKSRHSTGTIIHKSYFTGITHSLKKKPKLTPIISITNLTYSSPPEDEARSPSAVLGYDDVVSSRLQ